MLYICGCFQGATASYLDTIGPRSDGCWGYMTYAMFERLCSTVVTSNKAGDFSWTAGRALMR